MTYTVDTYQGEWAIFDSFTACWVLFFGRGARAKRRADLRCAELNALMRGVVTRRA